MGPIISRGERIAPAGVRHDPLLEGAGATREHEPAVGRGRLYRAVMADERARRQGALFAAGMGAVAGAALGSGGGPRRTTVTAAAGAVALAATDALAKRRQKPNEIPALWSRIAASAALAAPLGWALDRLAGAARSPSGSATGAARRRDRAPAAEGRARAGRSALPSALGLAVAGRTPAGALVAAATVVAYRRRRPPLFRDAQVSLLAERVPAERPAVRGAARGAGPAYVGTGYVATLGRRCWAARTSRGRGRRRHRRLARRAAPARTSTRPPSTRWCASSTSTPPGSRSTSCREWRLWVRPGYLLYRTLVARPLGQANVPMNQREAQRGVRSRIDTITRAAARSTVRGWIRSFADTDEPIYVGIYTTYRHERPRLRQRRLPAPAGQLHRDPAAAGRARRRPGADQPQRAATSPGHYLTYIDPATGELTTLAVHGFAERLDVYVEGGELRAEHAFWVFGLPFLVLHYRITRKVRTGGPAGA